MVSQITFGKKKKALTSKSHSSPTAYLVMISNQAESTNFSNEAVLWWTISRTSFSYQAGNSSFKLNKYVINYQENAEKPIQSFNSGQLNISLTNICKALGIQRLQTMWYTRKRKNYNYLCQTDLSKLIFSYRKWK